jgi:hypothetical protein
LPRQARDKHTKNSTKRGVFSHTALDDLFGNVTNKLKTTGLWCANVFFAMPFCTKKPNICQDRLGTNTGKVENERDSFLQGLNAHGVHG